MRSFSILAALGIFFFGSDIGNAQTSNWTSAGTHHKPQLSKPLPKLNRAESASKVNGAKVHTGGPRGASGGKGGSGSSASGPQSHPLHGADTETVH